MHEAHDPPPVLSDREVGPPALGLPLVYAVRHDQVRGQRSTPCPFYHLQGAPLPFVCLLLDHGTQHVDGGHAGRPVRKFEFESGLDQSPRPESTKVKPASQFRATLRRFPDTMATSGVEARVIHMLADEIYQHCNTIDQLALERAVPSSRRPIPRKTTRGGGRVRGGCLAVSTYPAIPVRTGPTFPAGVRER